MAIKTQGTELYIIDPNNGSPQVLKVGCPTSISGIDTTLEQIETTCLSADARTYVSGLATPGTATFTIQFDPEDQSHVTLHELKVAGTTLEWALGFSDGNSAPTIKTGGSGWDLSSPTRSWITFKGFMTSYPFSFELNTVVTSQVGIQISGEPAITPKAP